MSESNILTEAVLPPDDPTRMPVNSAADDGDRPHIGLVGDTYTVLLTGAETAGRFCLIDMHIPPGGGPPPHRHDFEETFIVQEGEIQATLRGETTTVPAGRTLHVPANAPHRFTNAGSAPARLLCICAPAGQDEYFLQLGVPVPTRTSAPPQLSKEEQEAAAKKAGELAPKYRTEMLKSA